MYQGKNFLNDINFFVTSMIGKDEEIIEVTQLYCKTEN